jgi:hypothetical protein
MQPYMKKLHAQNKFITRTYASPAAAPFAGDRRPPEASSMAINTLDHNTTPLAS